MIAPAFLNASASLRASGTGRAVCGRMQREWRLQDAHRGSTAFAAEVAG
jgi:hypothetical protein